MGETIDFQEVFHLVKRKFLIIFSIGVLAALASGLVSYYVIQPMYQSSTQLLVNRSPSPEGEQSSVNMNQLQADLTLVKSYHVLITSPIILDKVIADLGLSISSDKLEEQVTVNSEQGSQIIEVMVQDKNLGQSVLIANTIASIFQKEIVGLMNVDNVSVLTKATEGGSEPIQPNPIISIMIAFGAGLVAGTILIFIFEYFDRTVKSEKEAEDLLDLPVLATVTVIDAEQKIYKKLEKSEKPILQSVQGKGKRLIETREKAN